MTYVFQNLMGGLIDGKNLFVDAGVTTARPGLTLRLTSGSTAALGSATDVDGFFYGGRALKYTPTTEVYDVGEAVMRLHGHGEALFSSEYFSSGSMPRALDAIWAAANGLLNAATGTLKVGTCREIVQRTEPVGGVGLTQNLARIGYNIEP